MVPAAPPPPTFYLTVGEAITCLVFTQSHLVVGTSLGNIKLYCCKSWLLVFSLEAFSRGILWLAVVGEGTGARMVCQGRFEGVKVLRSEDQEWANWKEVTSHCITHQGFCKGLLLTQEEDEGDVVACPSGQGSLMVARLVGEVIRPLASLTKEGAGTLMAVADMGGGRILAGWENGVVVVWRWKTQSEETLVDLHCKVGTVMALAWDPAKERGVVVGSEALLVVVDATLQVVGQREVVNSGMGAALVRDDSSIMLTGGWDARLRVFSWKKPEKLKPLAVLDFHSEAVEAMTFSKGKLEEGRMAGKRLVAAGGKDGKVSLWDIYSDV